MTVLAAEDVSVRRGGGLVIDAASARFAPGLTAVIGPNGAGKSSLLAALAGLLRPAAGRIMLDGRALAGIPRRDLARRRAYLPQAPRAEWPISVERVVALGLTPALPAFGGLSDALRGKVEAALEAYDLLALRDRPATGLSGGELARAMLARATVGDPDLLIVDEPTAGLDPRHAIDAMRRLRARADAGCTVVLAIHDLGLAARFADQVIGLKHGRVAIDASTGEGFADATLSNLYDVAAHVRQDADGVSVRFLG